MPKKSLSDIGECTKSYEKWLASHIPLIPEDLRLKHAEMKKALFPFMRATFYRWCDQQYSPLLPHLSPPSAPAETSRYLFSGLF